MLIANSSPANEIKKNLNVIMFVADVPENYTFNKKLKDIWNFDLTKTMKVTTYIIKTKGNSNVSLL